MKQKQFFLVFNIPPGGKRFDYWPMWADENKVLWLANLNGRKNGANTPTVFHLKEDAQQAVNATNKFIDKNKLFTWKKDYIIQPINP